MSNAEVLDIREMRQAPFLWIEKATLRYICGHFHGSHLTVYAWLCYHANHTSQECFPSLIKLAEECGVHRSSVLRSLKDLEAHGLIAVDRSSGRRNVYKILNCPGGAPCGKTKKSSIADDTGTASGTGRTGETGPVSPMQPVPVSPMQPVVEQDSLNNNYLTNAESVDSGSVDNALLDVIQKTQQTFDVLKFISYQKTTCKRAVAPEVLHKVCSQYLAEQKLIKRPWAWFTKVFQIESGKHFSCKARDEAKRASREPSQFGRIMKGIQEGVQA